MFNRIKTIFYFLVLFIIFSGLGLWVGSIRGLIIGFVIAFVVNVLIYLYSSKIVLKMYNAKEADLEKYNFLYDLVKELSEKAIITFPKVYLIESNTPNVFATGRNSRNAVIAVTTGILNVLNPRELRAVIAHEMAHIKNQDILIGSVAAVIAGVFGYIAMITKYFTIFGKRNDENGGVFGLVILSVLAPLIAGIVSLSSSRAKEYIADALGASLCKDPVALADALQKLHARNKNKQMKNANPATSHLFIINPFNTKSLFTLFNTHPPIAKRVGKLRAMAINY